VVHSLQNSLFLVMKRVAFGEPNLSKTYKPKIAEKRLGKPQVWGLLWGCSFTTVNNVSSYVLQLLSERWNTFEPRYRSIIALSLGGSHNKPPVNIVRSSTKHSLLPKGSML
jgi:hypothetical protein